MAEYRLLTIWRIEAPLKEVYAIILDPLRWPDWWPGVRNVKQLTAGDADGIGNVCRYTWKGKLPYELVFQVRATRIENLVAIEGCAQGDLEGSGRWSFSTQGAVSVVCFEWHVRTTRWWMNLLAPLARSMFIRNHARAMKQGAQGLARLLNSPPVVIEHIDLTAQTVAPGAPPERPRRRARIDPAMVLVAGLGAGAFAAFAQLCLWRLAGMPLPDTLFRDARLVAALVMGTGVLPPPSTPRWDILLTATLIHFALSIAYAVIPARLAGRLGMGPALLAGAVYGLLIYALNLHGFTLLFPWFAIDRDWVTLVTHLVFGIALAGCCRLYQGKTSAGGATSKGRAPTDRP